MKQDHINTLKQILATQTYEIPSTSTNPDVSEPPRAVIARQDFHRVNRVLDIKIYRPKGLRDVIDVAEKRLVVLIKSLR